MGPTPALQLLDAHATDKGERVGSTGAWEGR